MLARVCITQAGKFFAEEAVVEAGIVSDKDGTFSLEDDFLGDLTEEWGIGDHFVGDAGQAGNKGWNTAFRIDQGLVLFDDLFPVMKDYGDFRNFVALD